MYGIAHFIFKESLIFLNYDAFSVTKICFVYASSGDPDELSLHWLPKYQFRGFKYTNSYYWGMCILACADPVSV